MRNWIILSATWLLLAASQPSLAHRADPVQQAQRAGRWLQLEPQQVQQLAHFLTDLRLERQARRQLPKAELLAVLDQSQKARLAELMLNRQWRQLRAGTADQGDRLDRLQQALNLSPAQVAQLRNRADQLRAENQQLREQKRQELVAIVGAENAARLEQRMAQRRTRGARER
ncbi:MAG: hypothetical protein KDI71_02785 [Xanthomonadales bacterium]|nr:hypothetical protein [Xanthomonadales bacterium]